MKNKLQIGLLFSLPFAAGLALAQQTGLPAVEVSPETAGPSISISCIDPVAPELAVVTELLGITDTTRAPDLRTKLMAAAAEACAAGEGRIIVQPAANGLVWKPDKKSAKAAADGK